MTNQFNLPNAVLPLEPLNSFNHDGLAPQQISAPVTAMPTAPAPVASAAPAPFMQPVSAPVTEQQAAPLSVQPQVVPQPQQQQAPQQEAQQAPVVAAPVLHPQDGYAIDEQLWDTAQRLGHCLLVPPVLRDSVNNDRTADRYLLLAKAKSIGISLPDAFTELYVLHSQNKGEAKVGMYVRTKAALCAKAGKWSVDIDFATGDAIAVGTRYSDQHHIEVRYTGYEASLRGVLGRNAEGEVIGRGPWADKWPAMMRTRALGRLLDELFPDIICNVATKEEFDDMEYAAQLQAQASAPQTADNAAPAAVAEIVTKARRTKKVVQTTVEQTPLMPQEPAPNEATFVKPEGAPPELPPNPFADANEVSA